MQKKIFFNNKRIIKDNELKKFGGIEIFAERARSLLLHQKENRKFLKEEYKSLDKAEAREIKLEGYKINIFYNPLKKPAQFSATDPSTEKNRTCALCLENLPEEQKAVQYGSDFLILANPYPVFKEQFTAVKIKHIPQKIRRSFEDLLNLSRDFGKYFSVFYNSPECGASITGHLHFQVFPKNVLPFEQEYNLLKEKTCRPAGSNGKLGVFASKNFSRKFITFESASKIELLNIFKIFYDGFVRIPGTFIEPMMNIISSFENDKWRVIIFPRRKYLPTPALKEGSGKISIFPAAVDLGGMCITYGKEDFEKITKENLEEIFNAVSVSTEIFEFLINRCETYFR